MNNNQNELTLGQKAARAIEAEQRAEAQRSAFESLLAFGGQVTFGKDRKKARVGQRGKAIRKRRAANRVAAKSRAANRR